MTPHNIRDFGARGDGRTPATAAFNDAFAAIAKVGGGQLHVPAGTYLCGTLELVDNLVLDLAPGAILKASPNLADYPEYPMGHNKDRQPYHFMVAHGLCNVVIRGGGCIDGSGPAFWHPDPVLPFGWYREKSARPSPMLEIKGCRHVRLQDVQVSMEDPLEDPRELAPASRSRQFSNHSAEARTARAAIAATNIANLSLRQVSITWPDAPAAVPFHALWGRGLQGLDYDPGAFTGFAGAAAIDLGAAD